ncbi:MAG: hypothetical protein ACK56F_06855, partial [bacterium]
MALADQQRPMTMTENDKGQEGPGTIIIIIREEEPGPGTCPGNARVSTLFQEGQVTRSRVQPPSTLSPPSG